MVTSSFMSTNNVGHAIADPNLKFPKRPRFLNGIEQIPFNNKLLFQGSENLQILSGNAVSKFLPMLLPHLDGTNTVENIITKFPEYSPKDITSILAVLFMRGLLDDAQGDDLIDLDFFRPEVLEYFNRNNDSTRVNKSAAQGLERLKNANLLILSDSDHGDILLHEIKHMGASNVVFQSLDDYIYVQDLTLVIVFCVNDLKHERLEEIDQLCISNQVPWMLTRVERNQGVIGPYFENIETPSYDAYRNELENKERQLKGQAPQELVEMWESYAAIEIVYFITKLAPSVTGVEYLVFNFDDWTSTSKKLNYLIESEYIAYKFENAIAFPSRHLITPKSHQMHYNPKNLQLSTEGKVYPSADLINLPLNTELSGDFFSNAFEKSTSSRSLDFDSLSTLLTMTGGIKESQGIIKRWAPTGGNLGSPQFYVIPTNVKGLEPELLFYQEMDQTLAKIGKVNNNGQLEKTINEVIGNQEEEIPDALIVITGNLERTAGKYNGFAYKIIHLDAGVALSQMQAVSKGLDLKMRMYDQWNEERLVDFLGINHYKEPVVGLAGIYGKGAVN
ncbi:nitroreductase family protein [Oceanobacillus sp. M65]|uniref:nitroreductase family protein n=1 Tax=Oceanobacillus sp. M65 TaxID=3457435 RepID=UPI003FCE8159